MLRKTWATPTKELSSAETVSRDTVLFYWFPYSHNYTIEKKHKWVPKAVVVGARALTYFLFSYRHENARQPL